MLVHDWNALLEEGKMLVTSTLFLSNFVFRGLKVEVKTLNYLVHLNGCSGNYFGKNSTAYLNFGRTNSLLSEMIFCCIMVHVSVIAVSMVTNLLLLTPVSVKEMLYMLK